MTPHVIPGTNTVHMEVIPKETTLSGTGSSQLSPPGFDVFTIGASGLLGSIALPRTRSSTIVTTMLLHSGQTAVIGGLSTDQETETVSRIPGISRIPILASSSSIACAIASAATCTSSSRRRCCTPVGTWRPWCCARSSAAA